MYDLSRYKYKNGFLLLEDGDLFIGNSIGVAKQIKAEICFNTTMLGYQEVLSDPSYAGQIITFCMPHVGNIGVNNFDYESDKIYASGAIFSNYTENGSHYLQKNSLREWLVSNNIVTLSNIDTRALVKKIRDKGSIHGVIGGSERDIQEQDILKAKTLLEEEPNIDEKNLAQEVSTKGVFLYNNKISGFRKDYYMLNPDNLDFPSAAKGRIVLIDFGFKDNIANKLQEMGFEVYVVPLTVSYETIKRLNPLGVVLSNGAGNPNLAIKVCYETIFRLLKSQIPLLGICMGHQILSLTMGAKVVKMYYGHHGVNHPVKNLQTQKIEITSQNHMYSLSHEDLPDSMEITHVSLFDNTVEGMKIVSQPVISLQYHPESSSGPHDSMYIFKEFEQML